MIFKLVSISIIVVVLAQKVKSWVFELSVGIINVDPPDALLRKFKGRMKFLSNQFNSLNDITILRWNQLFDDSEAFYM